MMASRPGEDADHVGAAANLLVQPLLRVVAPDLPPHLARERGERQDVLACVIEMGRGRELGLQRRDDLGVLGADRRRRLSRSSTSRMSVRAPARSASARWARISSIRAWTARWGSVGGGWGERRRVTAAEASLHTKWVMTLSAWSGEACRERPDDGAFGLATRAGRCAWLGRPMIVSLMGTRSIGRRNCCDCEHR
jgi:hypothetical protein